MGSILRAMIVGFAGILLMLPVWANADTEQGIAWLISVQNGDGSWGQEPSKVAATSEALAALRHHGLDAGIFYLRGLAWLANAKTDSTDALARKTLALEESGIDTGSMDLAGTLKAYREEWNV